MSYVILLSSTGGGAIGAIFLVIVIALIGYLRSQKRETDHKKKIATNPYDTKELMYAVKKNFEVNDLGSAIVNLEKILRVDKDNFGAQMILGIVYHSKKEYTNSTPLIRDASQYLISVQEDVKARIRFQEEWGSDLGLLLYYYGHILYMDNDIEKANKYKKLGAVYYKSYEHLNLY